MTEEVGQCPSHVGDTQGSDSYSWNTEKQQGSCFSCGLSTWLHEHTGDLWGKRNGRKFIVSKASGEVLEDDFSDFTPKDIKEPKGTYEYRGLRGVTKDTMEKLDLRYYKNQEWVYLDKPTNKWVKGRSDELWSFTATGAIRKRRLDLDKDHPAAFTTVGSVDSFFAQGLFPAGCSKKVTVVEGPDFDLASAYQMMQNGNFINPVVSLPGSKPSGKFWENTKAWLDSFEEIIFSADNDEPGRKVAEVMFDLFPGKVYMMDHGQHKDANDFLMNGDARAYKNAWWKAKKYSPAGFTASVEDWFAAIEGEDPYE